ncbi:hypothetical protein F4604DRAFT_1913942 [Suillus subluteus]|nr:hypothetical protein F4604DRAFT_1913942 [Suillus subluteus]
MDLLEEIFASSIVDRVRKTVFDSSWKKSPSTSGFTQNNIFQDGSRASLPFPPLPAVIHESHAPAVTRQNISTTARCATPRPAPTLAEVLQRPDFETWLLGQDRSITSATTAPSPQRTRRQPAPMTPSRGLDCSVTGSATTHQQPTPTVTTRRHRPMASTRQQTTPTRQRPRPARPNITATRNPARSSLESISSESSVETTVAMAAQEAPHEPASRFDSEQEASDWHHRPIWSQPDSDFPLSFSMYDSLQSLGSEQSGLPPPYSTVSFCHIPYSGPTSDDVPTLSGRLPDAHPDLQTLIHDLHTLVHDLSPLVHYRFGSVHLHTSIYPYLRTSAA